MRWTPKWVIPASVLLMVALALIETQIRWREPETAVAWLVMWTTHLVFFVGLPASAWIVCITSASEGKSLGLLGPLSLLIGVIAAIHLCGAGLYPKQYVQNVVVSTKGVVEVLVTRLSDEDWEPPRPIRQVAISVDGHQCLGCVDGCDDCEVGDRLTELTWRGCMSVSCDCIVSYARAP